MRLINTNSCNETKTMKELTSGNSLLYLFPISLQLLILFKEIRNINFIVMNYDSLALLDNPFTVRSKQDTAHMVQYTVLHVIQDTAHKVQYTVLHVLQDMEGMCMH